MEIIQIAAIGIVATILSLTVKKDLPQFSAMIAIITGVFIFMRLTPKLKAVFNLLNAVTESADLNSNYVAIILKVIGIAYIAEFGSEICADAGENSIASKIELGGKILIMTISAPILLSLLNIVVNLLP